MKNSSLEGHSPAFDSDPTATQIFDRESVIIVDDSRSAVEILRIFFEIEGWQVRTAILGEEAVKLASNSIPCVVFLDLGLPDINGYEVAEQLRKLPDGDRFFIVALTGRNEEEDRIKIQESGFDAHVVKPPVPQNLRDALKLAMDSR